MIYVKSGDRTFADKDICGQGHLRTETFADINEINYLASTFIIALPLLRLRNKDGICIWNDNWARREVPLPLIHYHSHSLTHRLGKITKFHELAKNTMSKLTGTKIISMFIRQGILMRVQLSFQEKKNFVSKPHEGGG